MELDGIPHLRQIDRPVTRGPAADPLSPRASEVIADRASQPIALVLGAPFGGGSLSGARCDGGPAAVRGELGRFTSYSSDFGTALGIASVLDCGDVDVTGDVAETQARIESCLRALLGRFELPVALLGGDNSITFPGALAAGADGLITFDAHHDVRDGYSNGSPVRQLLEAGVAGERIVQIGIHGFANARAYAERASDAGIVWVPPSTVREEGIDRVLDQTLARITGNGATRIWVDVDLDVLDRAFAPGTAAALPGGLWPGDLERAAFVLGSSPLVAGIDIAELDPSADLAATTTRTACAVLLAFVAGVASR